MEVTDIELVELPYMDRKSLVSILNQNNSWKELAVAMQFLDCEMDKIVTSQNPSEKILDLWGGKYGHTVWELFGILAKQKMYTVMNILKPYVPTKYHSLIKLPDTNAVPQMAMGHENQSIHTTDNNNREKHLTVSQVIETAGSLPSVSYEELAECTSNWNKSCILGHGGYATVFKGRWKNTSVAIKRIEAKRDKSGAHEEQLRQSISELKFLSSYPHENILPIYAYSISGPYPCLVYQFMSGGSLDKRIHTLDAKKFLSWPTRLDIAIGAARGLQYLHTLRDIPVVHVDIKPANILLDANDTPKIGDFGLARLGPDPGQEDVEVSRTFGTFPYLPFDFISSKRLQTKLDVYSFGVVLFEMATGLPVVTDSRKHRFLKDHVMHETAAENRSQWLQLKDKRLAGGEKIFVWFIVFGRQCVHVSPDERPTMVKVLEELEQLKELE